MLAGEFNRKLKKLNPRLDIYFGHDANRPATVYYKVWETDRIDYVQVCACDKSYVPEFTKLDETNHIVKRGWRKVIEILIARKLVKRAAAERVFGASFAKAQTVEFNKVEDPIERAIKDAQSRGRGQVTVDGKEGYHYRTDDLIDIARMVKARKSK